LGAERDQAIRRQADLRRDIDQAQRLIASSEAILRQRSADGSLAPQSSAFAELDAYFDSQPLAADQLIDQEKTALRNRGGSNAIDCGQRWSRWLPI